MSRRTIGGGRVLGSGRTLGPPTPPPKPTSPSPLPTHVLSPSASTISLNTSESGTSTPPSSDPQDIASRVSIDHGAPDLSLAAATDRLVCPICNEEMVTLLQLNRHLDDVHKEIQEEQQDEVKDWFKQQMVKAKKFQPLAVLNQKLKGLDVFESNNEVSRSTTPIPRQDIVPKDHSAPPLPPPKPVQAIVDPDDIITKQHWQRRTGYDSCSDPTCERRLGATTGVVNCRHCGKLFCDEHTMYQMKLSRAAQHEPVRGLWYRVCETCYKSREGYTDRHGLERDRSTDFETVRRNKLSQKEMEVSRLEKRLSRLTQLLANPPEDIPQPTHNKRWSLNWVQNDPKKALEQSIVSWQNDADVPRCPYCQQDFSQYTFRRHHCRTCGKVVCGDPNTGCSTVIGLNVATTNTTVSITEKPPPNDTIALDVRLCKECNQTIFSGRDFQASLTSPQIESFSRSYTNLLQFERGIRLLMPRFQKLLQALQDPDRPPTSQQISDASRTRKRLMDSFTQYDTAARRIRDMPSPSPTQLKLQKAIHQNATQFLHLHMLPLKSLPKVLKHATPHGSSQKADLHNNPNPRSSLAVLNGPNSGHVRQNSSSALSVTSFTSQNSARISELEAEEKSLRERLIVLEEQKFLVQEMIADANRRRKFDEVAALAGNVEDLAAEIDGVTKLVEGVRGEFEGLYSGSGMSTPQRRGSELGKGKSIENG
ncbi:carboxypeptidase Y-deficient [Cladophialophora chaetospira]|uniref:Carboxypeptidase Y-deficient n=1 Tax=Cladophialophora chaetospira TaxID=386627 RepID=A0AA38X2D3_9EURO|nr:carboxypeptidase Y-deficient [Cladophialophora chaetospira]